MAAGSYSFTIEQGATVDFEIRYLDSGSNPIDLGGGQFAEMRIRKSFDGESLAELTSSLKPSQSYTKLSGSAFLSLSGSDLATSITSGSIGVYIGHEVTSALSFSEAVYDLELVSGSAKTRLLQGKVKLSKQVTTV